MRALGACTGVLFFALVGIASGQDGIVDRLTSASVEKGESAFRKCKACHTIEAGGANRVGPNLYNAVNRNVASLKDYRYSKALEGFGGTWSLERLDEYLENPRKVVKGTRMSFAGIKDAGERADLIAYLNTQSENPVSLQRPSGADTAESASSDQAEEDFGLLVAAEGVEETYYACTACHSEMIVAQQGQTREGWDKMLHWMVEEQGMAEIPQPDRDIILDYLAEHYNTDRPNFPR